MLLKTNESERFSKLKRLCPPNSVVIYTSFNRNLEEFCVARFLADSPFQIMDYSPWFVRIKGPN